MAARIEAHRVHVAAVKRPLSLPVQAKRVRPDGIGGSIISTPPHAVRGFGSKLGEEVLRSTSSDKPIWCEEADVDYGLLLIFTGQGGPDGCGVIIRHRPSR